MGRIEGGLCADVQCAREFVRVVLASMSRLLRLSLAAGMVVVAGELSSAVWQDSLSVQNPWPVPMWRLEAGDDSVRELRKLVVELESRYRGKADGSEQKSNRGGYHSPAYLLGQIVSQQASTAWLPSLLLTAAADAIRAIESEKGSPTKLSGLVELELLGFWANVNKYGDGNVAHLHPGLLAGVLYLDSANAISDVTSAEGDDETINGQGGAFLCIDDPRLACGGGVDFVGLCPEAPSECKGAGFTAAGLGGSSPGVVVQGLRSGSLILFPAWLRHYVPPHVFKASRITIAFNVAASIRDASGPLRFSFDTANKFGSREPGKLVLPSHVAAAWRARRGSLLNFFNTPLAQLDSAAAIAAIGSRDLGWPLSLRDWMHVSSDGSAANEFLRRGGRLERLCNIAFSLSLVSKSMWKCGPADLFLAHVELVQIGAEFVQTGRLRRRADTLVVASVLQGSSQALLWVFDPRAGWEAAAAGDKIVRLLFGRKAAFSLEPGSVVAFPGWLETSLEVRGGSRSQRKESLESGVNSPGGSAVLFISFASGGAPPVAASCGVRKQTDSSLTSREQQPWINQVPNI